jgi:ABC-type multidrug transport system fused ATPase/permease subunit
VLVLDRGRVAERGTHAELLAAGGLYAQLHSMQFRES